MIIIRKILHNLAISINLLFALLLVLSDVSVYVSPEKFWIMAFGGLVFPYLLIINLGFVVFWTIKWRITVLISLVTLVVSINNIASELQLPFNPMMLFSKHETKSTLHLKILSYNVMAFGQMVKLEPNGINPKMVAFVQHQNPDIICFQEFFISNNSKAGIRKFTNYLKPLRYYVAFYEYRKLKWNSLGIAIFSKYPIVAKSKIDFPESYNSSMYVDIDIDGQIVRVYNNHLQSYKFIKENYDFIDTAGFSYNNEHREAVKKISFKLRDAYKLRAHQAERVSENIRLSPYPVIVCGDFNDTPVSYTYQKMKGTLNDAFRVSGKGMGRTYAGKIPSYRIDYIFYSSNFVSNSYTTYDVSYSDHYPISCIISNKNQNK